MDIKHAYCIMAHDNWSQLQKLIDQIDDVRNDIFLHIDTMAQNEFIKYGGVKTKKSKLFVIENPVKVEWSDISLSDAEVTLFEKVLENRVCYQYIHLLSGSDLPLMSQNDIHELFNERNEEFIDIDYNPKFKKRIKYYHFFVRGRRDNRFRDMTRRLLLLPQWLIVDRLKNMPINYVHGSEWCSLTLNAVREIVSKYSKYRWIFEKTTCSDEHYKQMILAAADKPFKFAKEGSLRYVRFDHRKASPRIITIKDYDEMLNTDCVFARKFKDGTEVYKRVCQHVQTT